MKPKKGVHDRYCHICKKLIGEAIHHGGKRNLKSCKWCKDLELECFECFENNNK